MTKPGAFNTTNFFCAITLTHPLSPPFRAKIVAWSERREYLSKGLSRHGTRCALTGATGCADAAPCLRKAFLQQLLSDLLTLASGRRDGDHRTTEHQRKPFSAKAALMVEESPGGNSDVRSNKR